MTVNGKAATMTMIQGGQKEPWSETSGSQPARKRASQKTRAHRSCDPCARSNRCLSVNPMQYNIPEIPFEGLGFCREAPISVGSGLKSAV